MADTGRLPSDAAAKNIIRTERIKTLVTYGTPVIGAGAGYMGANLLVKKLSGKPMGKYPMVIKVIGIVAGLGLGYMGAKTINEQF